MYSCFFFGVSEIGMKAFFVDLARYINSLGMIFAPRYKAYSLKVDIEHNIHKHDQEFFSYDKVMFSNFIVIVQNIWPR